MRKLLGACASVLLLSGGCIPTHHYQIPEGHRGWTFVEYDRPDCPPLPRVDGAYVIDVPSTGYVCTSHESEAARIRVFHGVHELEWVVPDGNDDFGIRRFFSVSYGGGARHWDQFCVGHEADCSGDPPEFPPR